MDKTMEDYASECRRIAEMTDDPIIRDEMMKMALDGWRPRSAARKTTAAASQNSAT